VESIDDLETLSCGLSELFAGDIGGCDRLHADMQNTNAVSRNMCNKNLLCPNLASKRVDKTIPEYEIHENQIFPVNKFALKRACVIHNI
jgi:hypothetical protein